MVEGAYSHSFPVVLAKMQRLARREAGPQSSRSVSSGLYPPVGLSLKGSKASQPSTTCGGPSTQRQEPVGTFHIQM